MTCIAALVHGGHVHMMGDSAGVHEYEYTHRADEKVFKVGPYLVGFSNSFRAGQVVRYTFQPPDPPEAGDLMAFMVRSFVPALRDTMKAAHAEGEEWNLVVGVRDRLFLLGSDYQVGESRDRMLAAGVGRQVALATLRTFAFFNVDIPPKTRLDVALRNAVHLSGAVLGPFIYDHT